MNWKMVLAGAIGGFLSAVAVDVNAWARSEDERFDWGLAVKRWIAGAVAGAAAGVGVAGAE